MLTLPNSLIFPFISLKSHLATPWLSHLARKDSYNLKGPSNYHFPPLWSEPATPLSRRQTGSWEESYIYIQKLEWVWDMVLYALYIQWTKFHKTRSHMAWELVRMTDTICPGDTAFLGHSHFVIPRPGCLGRRYSPWPVRVLCGNNSSNEERPFCINVLPARTASFAKVLKVRRCWYYLPYQA